MRQARKERGAFGPIPTARTPAMARVRTGVRPIWCRARRKSWNQARALARDRLQARRLRAPIWFEGLSRPTRLTPGNVPRHWIRRPTTPRSIHAASETSMYSTAEDGGGISSPRAFNSSM
jgi:hypothetical protein